MLAGLHICSRRSASAYFCFNLASVISILLQTFHIQALYIPRLRSKYNPSKYRLSWFYSSRISRAFLQYLVQFSTFSQSLQYSRIFLNLSQSVNFLNMVLSPKNLNSNDNLYLCRDIHYTENHFPLPSVLLVCRSTWLYPLFSCRRLFRTLPALYTFKSRCRCHCPLAL